MDWLDLRTFILSADNCGKEVNFRISCLTYNLYTWQYQYYYLIWIGWYMYIAHFCTLALQKYGINPRSFSPNIPSPVSVRWQRQAALKHWWPEPPAQPSPPPPSLSSLPPSLRGRQWSQWWAGPSCPSPFWCWPWRLARYFGRVSHQGQPTILHLSPLPSSFLDWIISIQKISTEGWSCQPGYLFFLWWPQSPFCFLILGPLMWRLEMHFQSCSIRYLLDRSVCVF
jgi:hypothetical protein